MFSFYKVILDLLKARTHKYVRRVPIGETHTGATKYKYYYQGQEGHGKGLGHEEELVAGASFAFGEGENKYHAHIVLDAGDRISLKYDDGDKKGQTVIMTKNEFRNMLHREHSKGLKQAQVNAKKQLKHFQDIKEKGAKVKQSTIEKLTRKVQDLQDLTNSVHSPVFDDLNNNSIKTYDDMNKFTNKLQDESINLDTKEKTIQFLQEYKANIEKITSILNKVLTQEELNKKFGMVEALTKPKEALVNEILIDHWRSLGHFIPIFEDNKKLFDIPFNQGLAETIDDIVSNISKEKNEEIHEFVIDRVKMMLEHRNAFRDSRDPKDIFHINEVNKEKIEDFIRNPPQSLSSDRYSKLLYDIPFVAYQKNKDNVIDLFLSSDKYGARFKDIPNIKEILKDQIDRGAYLKHRYHIDTDRLKKQIEALNGQSITLDNLPFLTEASSLDKLFDTPALDKLRNKVLDIKPNTNTTKTNNLDLNDDIVQSANDRKKEINTSIQALAKLDKTKITKDTFKNTLSNISKTITTKEDILTALKQVKRYLPELREQHKKAYPNKDDITNERGQNAKFLQYNDGRSFISKDTFRNQVFMGQILKNLIYNTSFNNDLSFISPEDLDSLAFNTDWDVKRESLDKVLDNLIDRIQKEPIQKSFRFISWHKTLLKSIKR